MSKEKTKLLKNSFDCYSIYQMLSHCAHLHKGMERTSSIIPVLELEKLKHSKVLLKILPPPTFFWKISKPQKSRKCNALPVGSKLTFATFALSFFLLISTYTYTNHIQIPTFSFLSPFLNPLWYQHVPLMHIDIFNITIIPLSHQRN